MNRKNKIITISQLIIVGAFFIWGIFFRAESNSILPSNVLGMLTKVQTTSNWQNFLWCFSNNLAVLFIIFWLNYWTFGAVGTIWCANSAFTLGALIKFSIISKLWLSVIFMLLELVASVLMMIASMRQKFEKNYKKMLIYFLIIAVTLLVAAILETIVLKNM
ncbi:MAG: stage II sporulation protein M [Oscillospiraceae bacterium]|nr:stage II sporulation protein M [Oscillospiraceae bacterium]